MTSLSSLSSSSSSFVPLPPSGPFTPGSISIGPSKIKISPSSAFSKPSASRPVVHSGRTVRALNPADNCVDAAPPKHNAVEVTNASSTDPIVSAFNKLATVFAACNQRLSLQAQSIEQERTSREADRRNVQQLENRVKSYMAKQEKRDQKFTEQMAKLRAQNAKLNAQKIELVKVVKDMINTVESSILNTDDSIAISDSDD